MVRRPRYASDQAATAADSLPTLVLCLGIYVDGRPAAPGYRALPVYSAQAPRAGRDAGGRRTLHGRHIPAFRSSVPLFDGMAATARRALVLDNPAGSANWPVAGIMAC